MSKKFTKRRAATPSSDPATLEQQKLNQRLRERCVRALRKRRRAKSHQ